MAELSNETKEDICMNKELLSLMEKSLPMYAVKCFLYAGYDNIPAITHADDDRRPSEQHRRDRDIYS